MFRHLATLTLSLLLAFPLAAASKPPRRSSPSRSHKTTPVAKKVAPHPPSVAGGADNPWPDPSAIRDIAEIGRGVAIVFSPDLVSPANRAFYQRLGFLFLADASWSRVLEAISDFNRDNPSIAVKTVVLETHGTNGHGLRLQQGHDPSDPRSYISVGALQERLEPAGVRLVILSACNAGRLFRPGIYDQLDPEPGDPLFMPASEGIINATPGFDGAKSTVKILRRADSHLETLMAADSSEFSPLAQQQLGALQSGAMPFNVSTMLMQMILHDPALRTVSGGYTERKSRSDLTDDQAESIFSRFVAFVDGVAERGTS